MGNCFSWGIAEGTMYYPNGEFLASGYSGNGVYTNKSDCCNVKDHGPLPVGLYTIEPPIHHPKCGKYTLGLTPDPSNTMYDRGEFKIHGDSIAAPGTASDGCIILNRIARTRIWESGVRCLRVVSTMGAPPNDGENVWGDNLLTLPPQP